MKIDYEKLAKELYNAIESIYVYEHGDAVNSIIEGAIEKYNKTIKIECEFCGRTESCEGEYPEGCFLANQLEANYEKNEAVQYGRWLLKNAISEDKGDGLCWYFDCIAYNNKELYDLWDKNFNHLKK
jgi:hypothetical protein